MMTRTAKNTVALGLVGALAMAGASPTWAAPVPSNTAAVKAAVSTPTTEVRFRHRGFGPGVAFGGLALGLAGAALAAPYYYAPPPSYGYAYGPDYYYGDPGYAYAPAPYAWGPHYRHYRHW